MLFVDLVLIGFCVFAMPLALLTGYVARSNGRSFWRWFGLGMLLPYLSVFVVMAVAALDQLRARHAAGRSRDESENHPTAFRLP